VIKKIWTSSYVLVAGGYSALLLASFYWIVDVRQWRKWCQPFVWVGMNSITIYLVGGALNGFSEVAERIVGGDVGRFLDQDLAPGFGQMVVSVAGLLVAFWFARWLYRRQIFLRL